MTRLVLRLENLNGLLRRGGAEMLQTEDVDREKRRKKKIGRMRAYIPSRSQTTCKRDDVFDFLPLSQFIYSKL